jgi:hypothetical protein
VRASAELEIVWNVAEGVSDVDGADGDSAGDDGGALALSEDARAQAASAAWSCWAAAGPRVGPGVGLGSADDLVRALADVVGSEPGPRNVRAPYRTPVPGLGPLDGFCRALRGYVIRLQAHGVPPEAVVVHVKRLVRDAMPSGTPEWSAHLLTEEVVRWASSALDGAPRDLAA